MRCTLRRAPLSGLLGWAAAALLVGAPAGADEVEPAPPTQSWYAEKITGGDVPARVEHMWSKGPLFHSETVVGGRPIITIVNGPTYYAIDPLHLQGMAVARAPAAIREDARSERPMGHEADELVAKGAEKVRVERMRGRKCDVYRLTNTRGRQEVWVTQDELRVPLHVEIFDRTSKRNVSVDFLEWLRDFTIPDSYFEPDPRVEMETLSYEDYEQRSAEGPLLPVPVLYRQLLHGPDE